MSQEILTAEEFRAIVREEIERFKEQQLIQIETLPAILTREQLKKFLHIKVTKASELLNRADFPVFREAGVLVPSHLLMQWIEDNTQWVKQNAKEFKVIRGGNDNLPLPK